MKNIALIIVLIFSYACSKSDDAQETPPYNPKQLGTAFMMSSSMSINYQKICEITTFNTERYHNGSEEFPQVGDTIYIKYNEDVQIIRKGGDGVWGKMNVNQMIEINEQGVLVQIMECE